ncbi:hypothetical protein HPB51_007651 [Rhipicephalus microplus]|uniref:Uncharacterized protein n=1 Tax=Rhipicephalus microplus TaxID=6941 RepID=A0A9J6D8U5_RHIMP|nr:hypothetical protein HPB51_007651 [Rhipicephalus microplus]
MRCVRAVVGSARNWPHQYKKGLPRIVVGSQHHRVRRSRRLFGGRSSTVHDNQVWVWVSLGDYLGAALDSRVGPGMAGCGLRTPSFLCPVSQHVCDLTFDVQGFKTGVKSISVDEQKQRKFLDHKSKAVEPVGMQTIPTNDHRCALTDVSHRWARPVSPVSAHVSQLNDTQMQTWASRTIETDATSHTRPLANRVAHVQPSQSNGIHVPKPPRYLLDISGQPEFAALCHEQ